MESEKTPNKYKRSQGKRKKGTKNRQDEKKANGKIVELNPNILITSNAISLNIAIKSRDCQNKKQENAFLQLKYS